MTHTNVLIVVLPYIDNAKPRRMMMMMIWMITTWSWTWKPNATSQRVGRVVGHDSRTSSDCCSARKAGAPAITAERRVIGHVIVENQRKVLCVTLSSCYLAW